MCGALNFRWCLIGTLSALSIALLCMRTAADAKNETGQNSDQMFTQLSAYNHTGDYIHQYYVNGRGGGNSRAYGGGGSFVCCIAYPKT